MLACVAHIVHELS